MKRTWSILRYVLVGIGVVAAATLLAVLVLTHTRWGMERARRFAEGKLAARVHGEATIGRLGGTGLLRGATIHDVRIADEAGRPFVTADSAKVRYDWRTFLRGGIILTDAELYEPDIHIEMLPGDSLWNYERIFASDAPDTTTSARRLILLEDVRIDGGTVTVLRPWEPDGPVTPADTARSILERVNGALATVMRFENVDATMPRLVWSSPDEPGRYIEIERISGRGFVWKDPFELREAAGRVTIRDSVIAVDLPNVRFDHSNASVLGNITTGASMRYDLQVAADTLDFADLRWLYPKLPAEGGGSLTLRIQSQQPRGILFLAENARLRTPGTEMAGTFGVVAGDTLYFTNVDLRASPLDLRLLKDILPGELPVDGLLVGTVEVHGPLSALRTSGDMRLERSIASGAAPSVRWNGTIDARGPFASRGVTADVQNLDLALLEPFSPGFPVHGDLAGRIEATGRLDRGMDITADLRHQADGRPESRFDATGTVQRTGTRTTLDLRMNAKPLSLREISAIAPSVGPLAGYVSGPVHLTGPLDDLRIDADLRGDAGGISFLGSVNRTGPVLRYAGDGSVEGFALRALRDSLPDATLTGRFSFDLLGTTLAELDGRVSAEIDSALIAGLPVSDGIVSARLADGIAHLDTLTVATTGTVTNAAGTVGLIPERSGELRFFVRSDGLEALEPLLFEEPFDPEAPRIAGTGWVSGTVAGNPSAFDLEASAHLDGATYDFAKANQVALHFTGRDLNTDHAELHAQAGIDSLRTLGRLYDSTSVAIDYAGGLAQIRGWAREQGRETIRLAGSVRRDSASAEARIGELRLGAGDDVWALRDTATVRFGSGGLALEPVDFAHLAGAGVIHAQGHLAWADATAKTPAARTLPLDFALDLRDVPFSEFLRVAVGDTAAGGRVDGRVTIGGTARAPLIDSQVDIAGLRYANVDVDNLGARFRYAGEKIDAHVEAFDGGRRILLGEGGIPFNLSFAAEGDRRIAQPLDFAVRADSLPVGLLVGLLDGFSEVDGLLDGTVNARGTTRDPEFDGLMTVRRGGATWSATGVRYRDLNGTLVIGADRNVAIDLQAVSVDPRSRIGAPRTGSARITGDLDFSRLADPGFDLQLQAVRLLAARRRDADLTTSGDVTIKGQYTRPRISGTLNIDGGTLYLDELYRQYLIVGLDDLFGAVDTSLVSVRQVLPPSQSPFLANLLVENTTVTVGPGSWLRGSDINVEVTGNLQVDFDRRDAEDLRISGALNVVRGTYRMNYPPFARIFDVRDGTVSFPGTPGFDPNMSINAVYRARTQENLLEIIAQVTGTLQSPRVRLTSDAQPPISESDLASYLFFGGPTYAFNIGSRTTTGASNGSGDAVERLGSQLGTAIGVGYFATGLQTLAQNFGLVDYVGLTAAETAPGSSAGVGGLLAGTQIELGRYISPKLFVAYTQRLASPAANAGARLEWRLSPTFTAEFSIEDRFARAASLSLIQSGESRKVYSLFLFREWGY